VVPGSRADLPLASRLSGRSARSGTPFFAATLRFARLCRVPGHERKPAQDPERGERRHDGGRTVNLRKRTLKLIQRETAHAKAGRPARIIAKINSLTDLALIRALYNASEAGVSIDLIVRGICMLRPGLPDVSANIRVRSIVGRFLEHSRLFYFGNNGKEEMFIGSADWMYRNLSRRVEVLVPIKDPRLRQFLRDTVLNAYLKDNVNARELRDDGTYVRVKQLEGEKRFDAQLEFENKAFNVFTEALSYIH